MPPPGMPVEPLCAGIVGDRPEVVQPSRAERVLTLRGQKLIKE